MKAQFVTFLATVQEALWLKWFLRHLGVNAKSANPIIVNCDSQVTIAYIKDPKYDCKTKPIDTKHNFVKDIVVHKEVNMKYISMCDMVVDPLTKSIARDVFIKHVKS